MIDGPYCYETEKSWLLTEKGQRCLFQSYDNARKLLGIAGAFKAFKVFEGVS